MKRRILAFFLALTFVFLQIPVNVVAAEVSSSADVYLSVEHTYGEPGTSVTVDINIDKNPGIAGAMITVAYDSGLTLTEVKNGAILAEFDFTYNKNLANKCIMLWDSLEGEIYQTGTVATLTFDISEDAEIYKDLSVNVSCGYGDIYGNTEDWTVETENGIIKVLDYIPGDIFEDKVINTKDIRLLRQYLVQSNDRPINEAAADVNDDGVINGRDTRLIRQYLAGGFGVVLIPHTARCQHTNLTSVPAKEATCTENGNIAYWSCECGKYFADENAILEITLENTVIKASHTPGAEATCTEPQTCTICSEILVLAKGHEETTVPGYDATYEEEGLTDGIVCSVCGETLVEQQIIPVLTKGEYTIQYNYKMIPQNMSSLKSVDVYNPKYGKVLETPILDKYKFLGWSDQNGTFYGDELPTGTVGDLRLYANWASERNKAVPVKKLGDPIICEDSDSGLILFVYEIGTIQNIPLFEKYNILSANGLITKGTKKEQKSITKTDAETISENITNTTSNSTAWTFSEDWNNKIGVSQEWLEENDMELEEAEEFCKTNNNTYNFVNSEGGALSTVNTDNSSYRISQNQAHVESTYDETQMYNDFHIGGEFSMNSEFSLGVNGGLSIPIKGIPVELGAETGITTKSAFEIGAEANASYYNTEIQTGTDSWSSNIDMSSSKSTTNSAQKTWNTQQGYSSSDGQSKIDSISKKVSQLISLKNIQDSSYSTGGSNGESQEVATSKASNNSHTSSVTYSEEEIISNEMTIETTANTHGGYRIVNVGTAKVFAVVGYDIKNKSYFTYTHSVLDDDEYKEYLDYSYDASFNDFETSILPFEIPIFVNDYVDSRIASSKLSIDDDGIVQAYLGDAEDEIVLIPSYYTRTNKTTGKPEMIKVKGIKPGLFKNNTNIIGISLGNFVSEIPESSFEGCTSLKEIICPNVRRIGANAFKGCSSLSEFALPNEIESIGKDAFDGIPAIKSNAPTKEIATIVASSNVNSITLDISRIDSDDFSDLQLNVGNVKTFKLFGGYKTYKGLSVVSIAEDTVISGVTITESASVPLDISSSVLTLERVNASGKGFALIMKADETELCIEGISEMSSESANVILSKGITFKQINDETYSKINTNGMALVCGDISNNIGYIDESKIQYISSDEYTYYLSSKKVTFDYNGGSGSIIEAVVPYGAPYGELPAAERIGYTFNGWYTEAIGGTEVTSSTIVTAISDHTLYARWSINDYTVTFDGNGGIPSESSKSVTYNTAYGTLPTATRDYHYFLGWYTEASGGTNITDTTEFTLASDVTLYAQWELKPVKGEVLASEMPAGAKVISRRYTYTLTEYKTYNSSIASGWGYPYKSERTGWGSTQGPVYSNPADGKRNVWSEQYISSYAQKTQYRYSRYVNYEGSIGKHYNNGARCYPISSGYCTEGPYYTAWSDLPYKVRDTWSLSSCGYTYGKSPTSTSTDGYGLEWYNQETRKVDDKTKPNYSTCWYYQEPIYTYYFKRNVEKSSGSYPSGSDISNIQEWVMYREK